jgi:hypothetical protein
MNIFLLVINFIVLTVVTFAFFGIRNDRPDAYYFNPLSDFVSRLPSHSADFRLKIYGNRRAERQLKNLTFAEITICEPEDLMSQVWQTPFALDIYNRLIRLNPNLRTSSQAKNSRLIAVWLAKLGAINQIFSAGADVCFWFDAGHWVSYQCDHRISRYQSELQNIFQPNGFTDRLLDGARQFGVIGCQTSGNRRNFHMPIKWMHEYADSMKLDRSSPPPLNLAVFGLIDKRYAKIFYNRFQYWWLKLINDERAGTEENALTLMFWEQQWKALSYQQWIDVFSGDHITPL